MKKTYINIVQNSDRVDLLTSCKMTHNFGASVTVAPLTASVERRGVRGQTTCRDELNSGCFTDRIRPKVSRRTNFD